MTDRKALLSAIHGNKTMGNKLTRWVNRLLPFNFKFRHLRGKEMGFTNLLSRLLFGRALPSSHYDNEFVVATINKITDSLSVKTMCTKKNCEMNSSLLNNQVDANKVYNITKFENINQTVGKNKKFLLIQRSFFPKILSYVTETIRNCNTNHSRSVSCTNS